MFRAFLVAEKIRRAVQQAGVEHDESAEGTVTVSLGVSGCCLDPRGAGSLKLSHLALYSDKLSERR
ncbi:hypothetical protein OU5_P0124 (plasmid) [Pseudomonas mandelii JR-1]|uniref:Uncharacterized protein n=1 Tax=Pseudomonas mandelii JR-1 TaxID=1147786 RepID=A0A024EL84_9PSED|nr:hypothetical protein OU5_P0124 [Pseudomonas mandelii JR-1]